MRNPFRKTPKTPMPLPAEHYVHYFSAHDRQRALELLWEHLTEDQRREYVLSECSRFTAIGNKTGAEYKIRHGLVHRNYCGNLTLWCLEVGGDEAIPYEDILLAKKILIEKDEGLFLKTAIRQ